MPQIEKFLSRHSITWRTGYGAEEALAGFKVTGYPAMWVIDRKGVVRWNRDSELQGKRIDHEIEALLNE